MSTILSVLKLIVPYLMVAIATLIVAFPFYQKVKTERNEAQVLTLLLRDSLRNEQIQKAEIKIQLARLESRDNLIIARYEQAMSQQYVRTDSIRRAVLMMTLKQQREYIQRRVLAVPQLAIAQVPDVGRYVTPVSYWKPDDYRDLTCYDEESVIRITQATAELVELRSNDSLQVEAFERLKRHYIDYRESAERIADYPFFRSKGKALRRLNRAIQVQEMP